jgi:transposase
MDIAGVNVSIPFAFADEPLFQQPARGEWPNRRRKPGRPTQVHEVSKFRWKVERSHGWLDNGRRLVTRYDWYTPSYVAFLTIACFMVALSRILE